VFLQFFLIFFIILAFFCHNSSKKCTLILYGKTCAGLRTFICCAGFGARGLRRHPMHRVRLLVLFKAAL